MLYLPTLPTCNFWGCNRKHTINLFWPYKKITINYDRLSYEFNNVIKDNEMN